jgi:GT2 family glycosyltransferase
LIEISVSIVTYIPKTSIIINTLKSLVNSIFFASKSLKIICNIDICDNTTLELKTDFQDKLNIFFKENILNNIICYNYISKNKNLGYGRANNLSLLNSSSKYHLILNPDVILKEDTILNVLQYMENNPTTDIVTPKVFDWIDEDTLTTNQQFLIKRYPSVLQLFLRGFAPKIIKKIFTKTLSSYECKDLDFSITQTNLEIVSGCFMFCKTDSLKRVGGFDENFFLYFEDFDLSRRISKKDYFPEAIIYHRGGYASKKGWLHQKLFIQSAYKFFRKHGWKWI